MRSIHTAVLKRATLSPSTSARALPDQTGSTYQRAPTKGLSNGWLSTEPSELTLLDLLEGLTELEGTDAMEDCELLEIMTSEELLLESTELLGATELSTLLLASLDVDPLQIAPVTVGCCAGLPAGLFPCMPNSIVCPGLILSFQPTPVAV